MKGLVKGLTSQISKIKNEYQFGAFVIFVCFALIAFFGKSPLVLIVGIIGVLSGLIFLYPLFKEFFEYHKSKAFWKSQNDYMKNQDQTKSPAFVSASGFEKNAGKKLAYGHVLKEINELKATGKNAKEILMVLEERIKGAINSDFH